MNAAELQAAGVNLAIVAWLTKHIRDVPAITSGVEALAAATTLETRWAAFKSLGDIVVSDLGDFPGFTPGGGAPAPVVPPAPTPPSPIGPLSAPAELTVAEVDAALGAIGDGHIINAVVSLVTNPQFLALVELILKVAGVAL